MFRQKKGMRSATPSIQRGKVRQSLYALRQLLGAWVEFAKLARNKEKLQKLGKIPPTTHPFLKKLHEMETIQHHIKILKNMMRSHVLLMRSTPHNTPSARDKWEREKWRKEFHEMKDELRELKERFSKIDDGYSQWITEIFHEQK